MLPDEYHFVTRAPVVPVMVIDDVAQAVPMARALVAGGLTALEITLRTDCALDAIRAIAAEVDGADIGAGTVCNATQMKEAVDAGASFIVSPGSSDELFASARELKVPLLPGAATASEVMRVREAGFPVVKFFPAATSGGAAAIKAFQGPFGDTLFVPTGGINLKNLKDYITLKNVPAVGGSWVLPGSAISAQDWPTITQLAREAVNFTAEL
ncbi:MAG: bifunctional 4-hydroxy-2-oxoglutarate aldolase/2-dehydro-3-deoxy-phosphogluconate aldolase [Halieaceae bacterium]